MEGEIQRQSNAGAREGKQTRRLFLSEPLDHCQERSLMAFASATKDTLQRVNILLRDDTLVLQEPMLAVDQVPLPHRVEGIEERVVMHRRLSWAQSLHPVIGGIQALNGPGIQNECGQRKAYFWSGSWKGFLVQVVFA